MKNQCPIIDINDIVGIMNKVMIIWRTVVKCPRKQGGKFTFHKINEMFTLLKNPRECV